MKRMEHVIDVKTFVTQHLSPYLGDASFLAGPSAKTQQLWNICKDALQQEHARG